MRGFNSHSVFRKQSFILYLYLCIITILISNCNAQQRACRVIFVTSVVAPGNGRIRFNNDSDHDSNFYTLADSFCTQLARSSSLPLVSSMSLNWRVVLSTFKKNADSHAEIGHDDCYHDSRGNLIADSSSALLSATYTRGVEFDENGTSRQDSSVWYNIFTIVHYNLKVSSFFENNNISKDWNTRQRVAR
jgi:hypothetical protein